MQKLKNSIWKPVNRKPIFSTNWIYYWQIRFFPNYPRPLKQKSDICEFLKHYPLKSGFSSTSKTFYRPAVLWWVDQKILPFHRAFLLTAALKKLFFRVFLLLSYVKNLCQNIWFIKNSKCWQFWFWKKSRQNNTNFSFFRAQLFLNGWPYWYEC